MSPLLWIGITCAFFHSLGNLPLSKQDWKINFKGLQIESSQIFTILILIISWPWALFRSRFLVIFRISLFEKSIVVSESHVFLESVVGSSLLFLSIEHWSGKKLLNISDFSLKSMINLSWCNKGGMQEIFLLFKKVFNIDQ